MRQGTTPALVPLWIIGIALSPALALAGEWSLPDESRGTRVAPLLLLSRGDIRADLQLNADQVAEAERKIAECHQKAASLRGRADVAAKSLRRSIDQDQWTWIEFHLSDDQRERLDQLELRWEGPAALASRPAVAEALARSDVQKAAIARAVADHHAARKGKANDPAAEAQFAAKALTVLTEGQKKLWDRMLGRPFTPRVVAATSR